MNILEARRRTLGAGVYKKTVQGNPVSVRSLARMRPGLKVFGKSEQFTTTGAQLIPFELGAEMTSINGVTKCIPKKDGFRIELNGTSNQTAEFDIRFVGGYKHLEEDSYDEYENLPAGTYYAKISDNRFILNVIAWRGTNITLISTSTGGSFEVQDGDKFRIFIRPSVSAVDATVKAIISKQNDSVMYEPYTGGKPSPSTDYPQEIKSAGDSGTVNVSLSDGGSQSQILPVQTPNGLPGIPVSTGGNYTDVNGQQWVCDEVDFKRGVYVQRNCRLVLDGNEVWSAGYNENAQRFYFRYLAELPYKRQSGGILCTAFLNVEWGYNNPDANNSISFGGDNVALQVSTTLFDGNVEEFKDWLTTNPMTVVYTIATPIETPLSASELAAYAALRTYSPTTVVSNDAGAWLKLGYKTKKSLEVTD